MINRPNAPLYSYWFDIRTVDGHGRPVLGYDAQDAAARFERDSNAPIYCRLHEGMPEGQRSGPVGSMGYFTPKPVRAATAQPMREGYSCGGMAVSASGEIIDLTAAGSEPRFLPAEAA